MLERVLDGLLGAPAALAFEIQQDTAQPEGVSVPLFPLLVALVGLTALVFVAMGAIRLPRLSMPRRRARPHASVETAPEAAEAAPASTPAPVFKKAPIQILFPMIRPGYPDVWGAREKAIVVFKVEDRGLVGQREIPGLVARIGDAPVPLVFYRGEARLERTFNLPGEMAVTVELKVRGERLARRASRTLRVVEYREEIANLFADFREAATASITPLRTDATAWEVHDALLDAKPDLSQVALREVVSSFEEAKFSNHPVGRATYEKMVHALRALRIGEV